MPGHLGEDALRVLIGHDGKYVGLASCKAQLTGCAGSSQPIALDDVAGTHIAVVLERHAAFLARRHFLHFILEALQRRQLALVHHDIVADQATLAPRSTDPSVTRQPATLPT